MIAYAILAAVAVGQPPAIPAEAWAQCIWQSVPTSAANWIEMPIDRPAGYQSNSQFQRLKYRLRSACWDKFMPKPSKPGVVGEPFDEAKVRDALIRTRPLTIGNDRPVEQAVVCQAFNGDSLVAEYFGFRNVESYGGYRVTCSEISNDGSLKPHA